MLTELILCHSLDYSAKENFHVLQNLIEIGFFFIKIQFVQVQFVQVQYNWNRCFRVPDQRQLQHISL